MQVALSPFQERQTALKDSIEFPAGYGDIQLISSNQVVFHFHQWPLMYVSPVFKDMFTIGDANGSNGPPSITLSEDSMTISTILRFIDPMKDNPTLDFPILPELLEAARKYQIQKAKDWVTSWLNSGDPKLEAKAAEFTTSQAIELLEVGTTFDVPRLTQFALRILIKAPAHEIFVPNLAKSDMFVHLIKLRIERVDQFRGMIRETLCRGANARYLRDGKFTIEDGTYIGICGSMVDLMHAVGLEPSYACCMRNWNNYLDNSDYIDSVVNHKKILQERCKKLEAELPGLP